MHLRVHAEVWGLLAVFYPAQSRGKIVQVSAGGDDSIWVCQWPKKIIAGTAPMISCNFCKKGPMGPKLFNWSSRRRGEALQAILILRSACEPDFPCYGRTC